MKLFKKYFLFIIVLLIGNSFQSSAKDTYVLHGYMGVQGGESFTYRLELKDSTGNYLSGYSYLYKTKDIQVKTAVIAQRDRIQKTLSLRETEIIFNQNFKSEAVICLVESNLIFDKVERNLKGSLITQTINNGGLCSKGTILFSNLTEIDQLFSEKVPEKIIADKKETESFYKKPSVNPTIKLNKLMAENKKKDEALAKTMEPSSTVPAKIRPPVQITEGKSVIYQWNSDKVIMEIWDGSQEDGDRISIFLNEKSILTNYTLTNDSKIIEFNLDNIELNIITIEALNEGGQPPNTANIKISDDSKSYEIIANNKIGKKASIRIRKKE